MLHPTCRATAIPHCAAQTIFRAGLTVKDVLSINHDIKPDTLREGQTILLPANKLSKRDAEILAGIGPRSYRLYPVRKGETLEAILTARKISQEEFRALNPSAGDSVKGEPYAAPACRSAGRQCLHMLTESSSCRLLQRFVNLPCGCRGACTAGAPHDSLALWNQPQKTSC